ncbi:MAG: glycoside hydrolase family 5 protein [Lachnospiraceae bacterium]|nr:glycoside hydrolase family 5 protein [Lachnospiraceae bacterium]
MIRRILLMISSMVLVILLVACGQANGGGSSLARSQGPSQLGAQSQLQSQSQPQSQSQSQSQSHSQPGTSGASLKVVGTGLCDAAGKPVQLKGVSTHGLSWFPQYVNPECVKDIKGWGANVFRLAMYTAEYNGYCTGGDKNRLKDLVRDGVRYATENEMYVIIDWHILSDGDPNTYKSEAISFFSDMSREFASNPYVIYEICNEPCNGTTWESVYSYANEVIPAIRANSPDSVIIVGTPNWSQDVDKAADKPLPFDNVMYALHFYAATHKGELMNKMTAAIDKGLPVIVSEFGICDASGNGAIDESSANKWVDTMNSRNISYICWNLSNKDEASALIDSKCNKTSGFADADMSKEGKWLKGVLQRK